MENFQNSMPVDINYLDFCNYRVSLYCSSFVNISDLQIKVKQTKPGMCIQ